ncbi:MAG: hypothetical protein ACR2G3_03910 [Solirubrobacterales bacterium]
MYANVRGMTPMRWAGFAAAVGGGLWAAKGTVILLTGDQPEYIFEVAPLFLALGLVGLHARLRGRGGRTARVGGLLAWAGVALAATTAAVYVATTDGEAFLLDATFPLAMLSIVGALVLLGIAVRRAHALPGRWRSLPLAIVAGVIPLALVGGILETISERLLEIPLVVQGLAWIALGYAIWNRAPPSTFPRQQRPRELDRESAMTASTSVGHFRST